MSLALSSITDSYEYFANNSIAGGEGVELCVPASTRTKLYGRDSETALLLHTYQQVAQVRATAKTVLVHGVSGSGKTALIDTIRQPVCENNGFFCAGKYFQNSGIQEPCSAIMAAFSDLCDLVMQSDDFHDSRKMEIQRALGSDGHLLANAISNLSPFLDESVEKDTHSHSEAAFARFKVACKTFLHAMSSERNPIVLFFDDVQWADEGSRQLIRMLLTDSELQNVMLMMAYRDEQADCVTDIISDAKDVVNIALANLQPDGVQQLICGMIGSTNSVRVKELSDLVAIKTNGNPFHIIQFVEVIQREGLMTFDPETLLWNFDIDQIQRDIMVSETLAHLLTLKVRRLSTEVLETLKIASLIGFRFQGSVVFEVASRLLHYISDDGEQSKQTAPSTLSSVATSVSLYLAEALQGKFIERTKDSYQFSHDKLQVFFQSMVDEEEEERLHLVIGETYLAIGGAEAMYYSAVHLHLVPTFVVQKERRIIMAQVNLEAAKFCKEKSAFVDAAILLRRGLDLLDPDTRWTAHYDLAFEMTEMLTRMELITGNHEACKELTRLMLAKAKTLEMKINPLLMDMEVRITANEMGGAVAAASRALKVLGIKMPRKVGMRHVVMKLLNVKRMLWRKTDDEILALPLMDNRPIETAVRILLHLTAYCFLQDATNPALYSALLAAQLMLRHGLSPHSSSAFTVYGIAELSAGNHARAYRFGKLALRLHKQMKSKDAEGLTIGLSLTLLMHWRDDIKEMPEQLHQATNSAFSVGDVVYGSYCLSMLCCIQTSLGIHLESLEESMLASYQKIKDLNRQEGMRMWVQPLIQCVLNLRKSGITDWKEVVSLTGKVMNEPQYMRDAIEANHSILIMVAWSRKAQLACLFGFWGLAESLYRDMSTMGPAFHFSYAVVYTSFFAAIASYSRYTETGNHKHYKLAQGYKKKLERVALIGSPNAIPFLAFLDAEELAVQKLCAPPAAALVSAAYTKAIEVMGSEKLVHMEAYANERAGFYYARQENRPAAEIHFNRAMDLYHFEWGAIAKYEWLVEKSEKVLSRLDDAININQRELQKMFVGETIGLGLSDIPEDSREFQLSLPSEASPKGQFY